MSKWVSFGPEQGVVAISAKSSSYIRRVSYKAVALLWKDELGSASWPKSRNRLSLLNMRTKDSVFGACWVLLARPQTQTSTVSVASWRHSLVPLVFLVWSHDLWRILSEISGLYLWRLNQAVNTILLLIDVPIGDWDALHSAVLVERSYQRIFHAVSKRR